jgi:WD40 repeat protein
VRIWDAETGKELHKSAAHGVGVEAVAVTADGRGVSGAPARYDEGGKRLRLDQTVRVWDLETGKELKALGTQNVWGLSVSPDGKRVLTGGNDKTARLYDLETGKELKVLAGHVNSVFRSAFLPGGKQVVTGGYDNTVRVWDPGP